MTVVTHAKENPLMYIASTVLVTLLGGGTLALNPGTDATADTLTDMQVQIAQISTQQQIEFDRQNAIHDAQDIKDIRSDMKSVNREINRLQSLPTYLGRELTVEEAWSLDQLKMEWKSLQEELTNG